MADVLINLGGSANPVAVIDDSDADLVAPYRWCAVRKGVEWPWRAFARVAGRPALYMHRLLLNAQPGQQVDHRDGNPLNNRRANLRLCTSAQNNWNRRPLAGKRVPYKGVMAARGKWAARIKVYGVRHDLGVYESAEEAAMAYDAAAAVLHGEFAYLNFPVSISTPFADGFRAGTRCDPPPVTVSTQSAPIFLSIRSTNHYRRVNG